MSNLTNRLSRLGSLALCFAVLTLTQSCTYYFGSSWIKKPAGREGNLHLVVQERPEPLSREETIEVGGELLEHFADMDLTMDEYIKGKVTFSRIFTARMLLETRLPETNQFLQDMEVIGNSGSTSFLNKKGDYDFREIGLVGMLYLFGDKPEVMYPATTAHIVNTLLIETGSKPRTRTPRTMGLMRDTENHILMKEITRYLRNQWIFTHTSVTDEFDNRKNGMDEWMIHHLQTMNETGAYEFNANPYMGYTLSALFTLHAFAGNDTVVQLTQQVLDEFNWEYALGAYNFRTYRPFRRRVERANRTSLIGDPHGNVMAMLRYKYEGEPFTLNDIPGSYHQAIVGLVYKYQLPKQVHDLLLSTDSKYFVLLGHGRKASPEVISAGDGFMLSAGGVKRGKVSQISPRPITLLLNDTATDVNSCFYIPDARKPNKWNQTGVYHKFAVGRYPANIPAQYPPVASSNGWLVFKPYDNLKVLLLVYMTDKLSLMVVYDKQDKSPTELLTAIQQLNPNQKVLQETITLPDGTTLGYQLKSPKNSWVITAVNGKPTNRKFDKWPRHQVLSID